MEPETSCPAPQETAIVAAHRFGIAQPRGVVVAEKVVSLSLQVALDPEWQPGFTEVWDMRFATRIDLLPTDIPKMLEIERKTKEALAGSTTLIITHKPFILYSAQFYARLVKPLGRTVIAVDRATEAASILGIDALPDLQAG